MPQGWFKSCFCLLGIALGLSASPLMAAEKPLTWQDCVQEAADHNLNNLLTVLDACRQVTLSQRAGAGQLAWCLRLRMHETKLP